MSTAGMENVEGNEEKLSIEGNQSDRQAPPCAWIRVPSKFAHTVLYQHWGGFLLIVTLTIQAAPLTAFADESQGQVVVAVVAVDLIFGDGAAAVTAGPVDILLSVLGIGFIYLCVHETDGELAQLWESDQGGKDFGFGQSAASSCSWTERWQPPHYA